jgi:hypothetical protein
MGIVAEKRRAMNGEASHGCGDDAIIGVSVGCGKAAIIDPEHHGRGEA